jgi:superfamily I DNA/RNA helicase
VHGNQPSYDIFTTPEAEDKFIVDKLQAFLSEGNIHPNEICIATRTNAGLDELKKLLNTANIKYLDLSNSKLNDNAIRVSTFHNMKGHEFKIVFVRGVSESTVPFRHANYVNLVEKEKAGYEQQERSLYYVVFSRAIQSVYISGVGEKSSWFAL